MVKHAGCSSTSQVPALATGQALRGASQEQASSQHEPPPGWAGVQQWVHEGSRWHTAAPQQHGSRDSDSSELQRRVSELAGATQLCIAVLHLFFL